MKVYHGSKQIIEKPITKGSKDYNDYGPAFYTTRDLKSAHEWACRNGSVGYVNEYEINDFELKVLDLTDKTKFSVLNWLAILMRFRDLDSGFVNSFSSRLKFLEDNYFIDIDNYDYVIGYRADDAYFRFPLDFIRGNITLEQLEQSFQLGKLGIQYVFISERAIKRLKYVDSIISNEQYIDSYFNNVKESSRRYDELSKDEDGVRIIDLMRKQK